MGFNVSLGLNSSVILQFKVILSIIGNKLYVIVNNFYFIHCRAKNMIASVSRNFLDPWSLLSTPAYVPSSSPGSQDSVEW